MNSGFLILLYKLDEVLINFEEELVLLAILHVNEDWLEEDLNYDFGL